MKVIKVFKFPRFGNIRYNKWSFIIYFIILLFKSVISVRDVIASVTGHFFYVFTGSRHEHRSASTHFHQSHYWYGRGLSLCYEFLPQLNLSVLSCFWLRLKILMFFINTDKETLEMFHSRIQGHSCQLCFCSGFFS